MKNEKYEITNIAHKKYPFLHRIRALRDIGNDVKAGDLGGFVESEENLSFEKDDEAWIYDDAISAGQAVVNEGAQLRDRAIACHSALVSLGSVLRDDARVEDNAYIRGSFMKDHARASGGAMVLDSPETSMCPILSGDCAVYGIVTGNFRLSDHVTVFEDEKLSNSTWDIFVITDSGRSVVREPLRDRLKPHLCEEDASKKARQIGRKRGRSR